MPGARLPSAGGGIRRDGGREHRRPGDACPHTVPARAYLPVAGGPHPGTVIGGLGQLAGSRSEGCSTAEPEPDPARAGAKELDGTTPDTVAPGRTVGSIAARRRTPVKTCLCMAQ